MDGNYRITDSRKLKNLQLMRRKFKPAARSETKSSPIKGVILIAIAIIVLASAGVITWTFLK